MRRGLLMFLAFVIAVFLAACGTKNDDKGNLELPNDVVNEESSVDSLDDLVEKTPLTLEDLDRINKSRFPVSYTYVVYGASGGNNVVETGEYVYPSGTDYRLLLPMYENIVDRKVVSSMMSNDMINTVVDVWLEDGGFCSIAYANNPDTLEFISAVVTSFSGTSLYTFHY